jgi:actin related protein 2/3 complex, subunit 1A/1B
MAAPEVFQLSTGPLTAVALSADRSRAFRPEFYSPRPLMGLATHVFTELATCPNNNDVQIYSRGRDGWDLKTTLSEVGLSSPLPVSIRSYADVYPRPTAQHDKLITAISWAPRTNQIVTCSQDRNAYVWTPGPNGEWKPALVLLRINRAATCVKWSPNEDKFAVGSGARWVKLCLAIYMIKTLIAT